jgi:hypothetical protein
VSDAASDDAEANEEPPASWDVLVVLKILAIVMTGLPFGRGHF